MEQIDPSAGAASSYPALEMVHNTLESLRRRWFWLTLCRVSLWWAGLFLTSTTMICLAAGVMGPGGWARGFFLTIWLAGVFAGPAIYLYLLIFRQPDGPALAALADREAELRHNYLTNALQLADDPFWSPRFVARVIAESAQVAGELDIRRVLPSRRLQRSALALGIGVLLSLVVLLAGHRTVRAGLTFLFSAPGRPVSEQTERPTDPRFMTRADLAGLLGIHITGRFPTYLQRPPQSLAEGGGEVSIPEGTELEFIVVLREKLRNLRLATASGTSADWQDDESELRYRGIWRPVKDDGYGFTGLYRDLQLRWPTGPKARWPVKVIPDQPPVVRLVEPDEDTEASPGTKIHFTLVAQDDHGLSDVKLVVHSSPVYRTNPGTAKATAETTWTVPIEAKIGDTWDYWAEAVDNRDLPGKGPQVVRTKTCHLKIVSPKQYKETREAALASLREQLQAILAAQIHARSQTLAASQSNASKPAGIGDAQKRILGQLKGLADQTFPSGLAEVGRAIGLLARGPAANAAGLAERLSTSADFKPLLDTQQEIITTLESILQMLQESHGPKDAATQAASQPADQPSMQKLSDLLGKFIDQQRLALKSTQDLAAKAPEDFSQKDKADLEALKQLEEKWDRFLQQALNDMDKLARQDFSASVAKQELVEIQSQVQMAEDAMKQQSVKIAVPAEQTGLELAKELLHNIERWMSDVPDRLKWEMEEPPAPIDVPMAQLPEELEDIIGDLIEKEQDLYDQIEDETSSWADSLDKGAGWTVMDGPMSNFSAKGITGNLLPNKNEISGRSGEGRTGRSSGEFVEQTAQGKGGRRTPTRLTKDAFQSGQVDERSKEPAGGATGGGKLSGAGAEGLTGPRPRQMMPNLPALKDKQALLLSKTKMAQWQSQKNNWGNFQLDKVIRLMAANKADMDRGAYRSVLARRNVLIGSLKASKTLLAGKFQLDQPEQRLPKTLQAQIQSTDPQAIPESLRPMLNKYYQLLAQPPADEGKTKTR